VAEPDKNERVSMTTRKLERRRSRRQPSTCSTAISSPQASEIEVSLFGPGYGECAVLHLGGGEWMVVDSCIDSSSGRPVALQYLEGLGVEPSDAVRLVVATHAHDDHIAGIANVLLACQSASFVRPAATTREEFVALLEADEESEVSLRVAAYREYRLVEQILESRHRGSMTRPVIRGLADRVLFERVESATLPAARVLALSPSDEALDRSLVALRALLPTGGVIRRLSTNDPNTMALALSIEVGDATVLLGADLESGPIPNCGWAGVSKNVLLPAQKATVYKVAHHGSSGAHSQFVWSSLLNDEVIAILSPHRRGRTPLPSPQDRARICAVAPRSYITADPDFRMMGGSTRARAAEIRGAVETVRLAEGETGQIQLRRSLVAGSDWRIELFRPARSLCG
jgi:beta-lactamase superfamily II metal-dependent hydrolase